MASDRDKPKKYWSKTHRRYYWSHPSWTEPRWETESTLESCIYVERVLDWELSVLYRQVVNPTSSTPPLRGVRIGEALSPATTDWMTRVATDVEWQHYAEWPWQPTTRVKADVVYLPFECHKQAESEVTLRAMFRCLHGLTRPGSWVLGLMPRVELIRSLLMGEDRYHRWLRTEQSRQQMLTSGSWQSAYHGWSVREQANSLELVWRYGAGHRSRGWLRPLQEWQRWAQEYQFDIVQWSGMPFVYYQYAQKYLSDWQTQVGIDGPPTSAWTDLEWYDVFCWRRC